MNVEEKRANIAVMLFLFMPVLMALVGVMIDFNSIDFGYLLLVAVTLVRYVISKRK